MKTWADLKHGDIMKYKSGEERYVIDILPNSILVGRPHEKEYRPYFITIEELETNQDWQIVQPEEEEEGFYDQSLVDYKDAFLRLEASILNLGLERKALRAKYPHLFN